MAYAEKVLGLSIARIATYNPVTAAIGTSIELTDPQMMEFTPQMGSDTIEAKLQVVSAAGWIKAMEFSIEWGSLDRAAMVILLGSAFVLGTESGTTPSRTVKATMKGGLLLPRFAVAGYSQAEADGAVLYGSKNCQITELGEYGKAADGKYWLSKCKGIVLPVSNALFIQDFKETDPDAFADAAFQSLFA